MFSRIHEYFTLKCCHNISFLNISIDRKNTKTKFFQKSLSYLFQTIRLLYDLFAHLHSFQVESIVDHKKQGGKTVYRIRWKGYAASDDTWLPANELSCKEMLKKYKKKIERENKDVYSVSKLPRDSEI